MKEQGPPVDASSKHPRVGEPVPCFFRLSVLYPAGRYRRLLLPRTEAEGQVKRAESDEARDDEDHGQDAQDDGRQPRQVSGEVKDGDHGGEQQPDGTIHGSHVFLDLHFLAPFVGLPSQVLNQQGQPRCQGNTDQADQRQFEKFAFRVVHHFFL